MANNTLTDLNNHLYAQLERLGDEDLSSEEVKRECERAKAINGVAKNIIDNAKVTFDVVKYNYEGKPSTEKLPAQLQIKG